MNNLDNASFYLNLNTSIYHNKMSINSNYDMIFIE